MERLQRINLLICFWFDSAMPSNLRLKEASKRNARITTGYFLNYSRADHRQPLNLKLSDSKLPQHSKIQYISNRGGGESA